MIMRLQAFFGLAALPLAIGCANVGGGSSQCAGADAEGLIGDIFREAIEDSTRAALGERGEGSYSASKIRATVGQLKFGLLDVRTTKDDPDSTKQFCNAALKVTVPLPILQDAERALSSGQTVSISTLADQNDLDRKANAFQKDIEYSVQPTDEGDKVYAETETDEKLVNFYGQLMAAHLLSDKLQQQAAEQSRQEAEARAAEAQAQRETQLAADEQRQAVLGEVKAENDLARQTINALWTSVPQGGWGDIGALQKAWVRRKEADCKVEAAAASIDPAEKEAARLRCDTRMTYDRIQWLRQRRPNFEVEASESY
jgi:uncharacterized protein YecT (DUF1311 family)